MLRTSIHRQASIRLKERENYSASVRELPSQDSSFNIGAAQITKTVQRGETLLKAAILSAGATHSKLRKGNQITEQTFGLFQLN